MKKIILLILAACIMLSLVSCGKTNNNNISDDTLENTDNNQENVIVQKPNIPTEYQYIYNPMSFEGELTKTLTYSYGFQYGKLCFPPNISYSCYCKANDMFYKITLNKGNHFFVDKIDVENGKHTLRNFGVLDADMNAISIPAEFSARNLDFFKNHWINDGVTVIEEINGWIIARYDKSNIHEWWAADAVLPIGEYTLCCKLRAGNPYHKTEGNLSMEEFEEFLNLFTSSIFAEECKNDDVNICAELQSGYEKINLADGYSLHLDNDLILTVWKSTIDSYYNVNTIFLRDYKNDKLYKIEEINPTQIATMKQMKSKLNKRCDIIDYKYDDLHIELVCNKATSLWQSSLIGIYFQLGKNIYYIKIPPCDKEDIQTEIEYIFSKIIIKDK